MMEDHAAAQEKHIPSGEQLQEEVVESLAALPTAERRMTSVGCEGSFEMCAGHPAARGQWVAHRMLSCSQQEQSKLWSPD